MAEKTDKKIKKEPEHGFLKIEYDATKNETRLVSTNLNDRGIEELCEAYLHGQMGRGIDERTTEEHEVYKVRLEIDLSCDKITTRSNTGNHGLTAGIVLSYYRDRADSKRQV